MNFHDILYGGCQLLYNIETTIIGGKTVNISQNIFLKSEWDKCSKQRLKHVTNIKFKLSLYANSIWQA